MAETENPLTSHAQRRLRQLAEGNGMEPESIHVVNTEEKDVKLGGVLRLTPTAEVEKRGHTGRFTGFPRDTRNFGSFAELSKFTTEEQQKYAASEGWFSGVQPQIDEQPGKGWGLKNVRITYDAKPDQAASASEACPACHGDGATTCNLCHGQRVLPCEVCFQQGQETCYSCHGSGQMMNEPGKPCPVCNGSRFTVCRVCQGQRVLGCAQCKGKGQIVCPPCEGSGKMVELAILKYGVDAVFNIADASELPAALRRALDRHGMKFLAKGHATIDYKKPADEIKGSLALNYSAEMPCADIVMNFGKEKKRITAFGLRRALLDVPMFLDKSLAPGIKKLEAAGKGRGDLDAALKFRALRDACHLALRGLGTGNNLRRQYPYGLSKGAADKILRLTVKALRRASIMARYGAVAIALLLGAGLGAALYLAPVHNRLGMPMGLAVEIILPLACAALGYKAVDKAAIWAFRRKFPDVVATRSHGGLLAALAALGGFLTPFAMAFLQPEAAFWLRHFVGQAGN